MPWTGFTLAVRRLVKAPLFTVVTLVTLAVGIGANAAIFSVIYGVLLKPLPFAEPERLVSIWHTAPGMGIPQLNDSPSTYFIYREHSRVFQDVGLWNTGSASITGRGEPERIRLLYVTDGFLPVLGVTPAAGRVFRRRDDVPSAPDTVMLTWGYWQRKFGKGPVVGQTLTVSGKPAEIIGVLPRSFSFLPTDPEI